MLNNTLTLLGWQKKSFCSVLSLLIMTIILFSIATPCQALKIDPRSSTKIEKGAAIKSSTFAKDEDGWYKKDKRAYQQKGAYQINNIGQKKYRIWRGFDTEQIVAEVDVKTVLDKNEGYGFGFIFRQQGKSQARYCFWISSTGSFVIYRVSKEGKYKKLVPWKKDPVIKKGQGAVNHLELRLWNKRLDFYINGKKVASVKDSTYPSGSLGFQVNKNQHIAFDNFKLSKSRLKKITAASTAPRLNVNLAELAVPLDSVYEEKKQVVANIQSRVQAPDGTILVFPERALSNNAQVTLQKLQPPSSEDREPVVVYDIDISGGTLQEAITINLPLSSNKGVNSADDVLVLHLNEQKMIWEQLKVTLAPDLRSVSFRTDKLSKFALKEPGWFLPWRNYYEEAIKDRRTAGPLAVPYYAQGEYGWCWAASLSMIDGFEGAMTKIWEVAAYFQVADNDAASSPGKMQKFLQARHPTYSTDTKSFWSSKALNGYLMYHLDRNHPIWIGLPYAAHAVVVVGYDIDHIYVHDPSGALIKRTGGEDPRTVAQQGRLGAYRIPLDRWNMVTTGNWMKGAWDETADVPGAQQTFSGIVWPVGCLVITSPPSAGKTQSLQLMSWESFDLERHYVSSDGRVAINSIDFYWNGKNKWGCSWKEGGEGGKKTLICNSDQIRSLTPFLSNTLTGTQSMKVEVLLDKTKFAEEETDLPGKIVQQARKLSSFSQNMNFASRPLSIGQHLFEFRLRKGDQLVDQAKIFFNMAPALVRDVRVLQTDTKTLKISWSPNPEEANFGTPLTYRIMRSRGRNLNTLQTIGQVGPGKYEFKYTIPKKDRKKNFNYTVWAIEPKTKLESPSAVFNRPEKDKGAGYLPLLYGTRLEYSYDLSQIKKMIMQTDDGTIRKFSMQNSEVWEVTGGEELTITSTNKVNAVLADEKGNTVNMNTSETTSTIQSFTKSDDTVTFGDSTVRRQTKGNYGNQSANVRIEMSVRVNPALIVMEKMSWPEKGTKWTNDLTRTARLISTSGRVPDGSITGGMDYVSGPGGETAKIKPGTSRLKSTCKATGFETVTVKAGTFEDCARIEISHPVIKKEGVTVRSGITQWYAEGIGLVKETMKTTMSTPDGGKYRLSYIKQLTSYQLPEEK